mmetsp:Transcript_16038/g.56015  ORF Transcript_16038/g.56015 Transcript_16038/m.56015 type:complete len:322 (+) Transcript_16038:5390-6355(+)
MDGGTTLSAAVLAYTGCAVPAATIFAASVPLRVVRAPNGGVSAGSAASPSVKTASAPSQCPAAAATAAATERSSAALRDGSVVPAPRCPARAPRAASRTARATASTAGGAAPQNASHSESTSGRAASTAALACAPNVGACRHAASVQRAPSISRPTVGFTFHAHAGSSGAAALSMFAVSPRATTRASAAPADRTSAIGGCAVTSCSPRAAAAAKRLSQRVHANGAPAPALAARASRSLRSTKARTPKSACALSMRASRPGSTSLAQTSRTPAGRRISAAAAAAHLAIIETSTSDMRLPTPIQRAGSTVAAAPAASSPSSSS